MNDKTRTLKIPRPSSGGIFLSYRCSSGCRHCMYACSPQWSADWITEADAEKYLRELSDFICPSRDGCDGIGINEGLHITGGEPFLNFDLMVKIAGIARNLKIPSLFVETNCFWAGDDKTTMEKLRELKEAGLSGILVSINPFVVEHVPFERTKRVAEIGAKVFGKNVLIYQRFFYSLFSEIGLNGTIPFEKFIDIFGLGCLNFSEMIPMGRFPFTLGKYYRKFPASAFFDESCNEELTRNWHIHVDNYGNYISGFCGGVSLCNVSEINNVIRNGLNLDDYPILSSLATNIRKLFELAKEFDYKEDSEGYISKCHLCIDIRKHLVTTGQKFKELKPEEFYRRIS